MANEQIPIDLDPRKVLDALKDVSDEVKKLAVTMEDALGKKSVKSVDDLADASEKGANKIMTTFRNLGKRVKEDLKTAFDATGVMSGIKIAKDIGEGVKQVFDLERAFDRLNTRLRLSTDKLNEFKTSVGRKVAATGQKLEDILPGVETVAAKGGVKSPEQLAAIGEILAQVKATTAGEDINSLSGMVVEILKTQGQSITAASFKKTVDALQGGRVRGAFMTAGETAGAVERLSKAMGDDQAKRMSTRELTGLAVMASRGGEHGVDVMEQVLQLAKTPGGQGQLQSFFGRDIIKNGKFNAGGMQNANQQQFGQFSEYIRGQGLQMDQGDLSRWIKSMKSGMEDFKAVVNGADETATQFKQASDNLATKVDIFKQGIVESGREIGESIAKMGNDLIGGHMDKLTGDLKGVMKSLSENKGSIASVLGLTAAGALLGGGGLNRILKRMPGGGIAGGLAQTELAKATGIQPVYVTNAKDIGMVGVPGVGGEGGAAGSAMGALTKVAGGFGVGALAGEVLNATGVTDMATDYIHSQLKEDTQMARKPSQSQVDRFNQQYGTQFDVQSFEKAIESGMTKAIVASKRGEARQYIQNPSSIGPRGGRH